MANRLYQQVIHQMKDVGGRVLGIIDENAIVVACNDLTLVGTSREDFINEQGYSDEYTAILGFTVKSIHTKGKPSDYVFVEGIDETAKSFACIISVLLQNLRIYFDEKNDKSNLIKNILIDNILPGEIYFKAKELGFISEAKRVVFLIEPEGNHDVSVFDVVRNMFPEKGKDYVISVDEKNIVIVKELDNKTQKDIGKIGREISDTLSGEFFVKCSIGIGSIVDDVKDLALSFREAKTALEVGRVFDTERTVISYENLGIGRIIYQLPTTLCEMFLAEVFKNNSIDALDQETLFTVQKFFENSLNISETSRKLFVHRNTLVYRLDKIKKITGLDIREFEDAITFKVALMVKRYLNTTTF